MARHVVVGAGAIGKATAVALASAGHEVVLASRSGVGPALDAAGITRTQVQAADADALTRLAAGAVSLVNAVNPAYTRWPTDWPPVAAAFLDAAQRSGAGLVTVGNLYGYGPAQGPVHAGLPLATTGSKGRVRAQMWLDAKAAHDAGRIRATEVRASDYFGPGATEMSFVQRFVMVPAAAGRTVRPFDGSPTALHSWSYVPDIGATVAAVAMSDAGWGRAWHVPSGMPRSLTQVVADIAAWAGRTPREIRVWPAAAVRLLGVVVPIVRELGETAYQRERDFVVEASDTTATFGVAATPWEEALAATLPTLGAQPRKAATRT